MDAAEEASEVVTGGCGDDAPDQMSPQWELPLQF